VPHGNKELVTNLIASFGKWSQVTYLLSIDEDIFVDVMFHPRIMMT
jgi:hypothetical protein